MDKKYNQCEIFYLCNMKQMINCKYYEKGFNTKKCKFNEDMHCNNRFAKNEALSSEYYDNSK